MMTDMQIFREKCVRGVSVLWYDENGEVIRQLKGGISPVRQVPVLILHSPGRILRLEITWEDWSRILTVVFPSGEREKSLLALWDKTPERSVDSKITVKLALEGGVAMVHCERNGVWQQVFERMKSDQTIRKMYEWFVEKETAALCLE